MKNTKPGHCPQVKSCKTGNLSSHNVGAGVPGKPPGQGPSGTHGSYSKGSAVGSAKHK